MEMKWLHSAKLGTHHTMFYSLVTSTAASEDTSVHHAIPLSRFLHMDVVKNAMEPIYLLDNAEDFVAWLVTDNHCSCSNSRAMLK